MKELFWKKHSENRIYNIKNFRNSKKNNIFANWSPYTRGLTYYNFFLNYYVKKNKKKFLAFKKKINNLNLGNAPGIKYDDKYNISYDDCLSFEEIIFLKDKNKMQNSLKYILEIGPGYGRTVEAFITNFNVNKYFIIDYENVLNLTNRYLKKTLSKKLFKKIIFIKYEDFNFRKNFFLDNYNITKFDLLINADSFHEMESRIIKKYLKYFSKLSNKFFIKNAIGKYRPRDLINHLDKKITPHFNKKLGLCNNEFNVFNNLIAKKLIKRCKEKYRPSDKFQKNYSEMSELYPSVLLILYK